MCVSERKVIHIVGPEDCVLSTGTLTTMRRAPKEVKKQRKAERNNCERE